MKEELSDILYKFKDDLFYFEEEAISEILTLFNKKIEDSKDEVRKIIVKICASEFLDVSVYADKRTQDIINIIKGEVEK